MCGTWFRKIQKIEDVFEGKLSVSGLVGCWMAGVVLREPPYWETLTGICWGTGTPVGGPGGP